MKMFQPSVRALLLGSVFFTGTRGVALADHRDELTSKLRTASEKFSELQESRTAYFARSEITGTIDGVERERADLIANIRQHEVVIAGLPRLRNGAPGWNNLQEGVRQDLLVLRQQLTETAGSREELKFCMREMDEITLRQAETSGGRGQAEEPVRANFCSRFKGSSGSASLPSPR